MYVCERRREVTLEVLHSSHAFDLNLLWRLIYVRADFYFPRGVRGRDKCVPVRVLLNLDQKNEFNPPG